MPTMLPPNCKHQLFFSLLILCFLKYELHYLPASPHNYDHDGLRMLQVRAPTSPHINGAHDHQHFKVGEPEPPQGSPDYDAHDRHLLKVGAPERTTTSPRRMYLCVFNYIAQVKEENYFTQVEEDDLLGSRSICTVVGVIVAAKYISILQKKKRKR
ncbi:hypothetical protein Q3G72_006316 [Acer saccharum]|nr:hypothetical protein Q3G72_006316 [Acer saccharum]